MAGERVDFLSPLSVIPGMGPKRIQALNDAGLYRVEDLLYNFPRKFLNKGAIVPISELVDGKGALVRGEITIARVERGKRSRLRVAIRDGSGSMELLWFAGLGYLRKALQVGRTITVYGIPKRFRIMQMVHPEVDYSASAGDNERPFEPRYSLSGSMRDAKIGQKRLIDAVDWLFEHMRHFPRKLPNYMEEKYRLPDLRESLLRCHFPQSLDELDHWFERIQFEELYEVALNLRWNRRNFALPGRVFSERAMQMTFMQDLPFSLTDDQRMVIEELFRVSDSEKRMHHLLQGDVGSGKTVTAFLATLPALEAGYQIAWLAPTTVLAEQSYKEIYNWLKPLGYDPRLLTGNLPASEKREIQRGLTLGEISFVVGTHALISDTVSFAKLGMVVVDEQHRFGTEQRLALQQKDNRCDVLMMSATPIPASLAATVYSDLELLSIRSMPKGRKPVKTHLVPEIKRGGMLDFVKKRIETGERVFWVVPRIDSVEDDCNELADIEAREKELKRALTGIQVGVLHGRMTAFEKEAVMECFLEGSVQLLLATTVIEVGVNVPEATVIVVENSENFGLAQLHQLRGRVGRSDRESWAFLLTGKEVSQEAVDRLQGFCSTNDGFKIAELDLQMRGIGQVMGTRQSGFSDLRFSNILEMAELFKCIRQDVEQIMSASEAVV